MHALLSTNVKLITCRAFNISKHIVVCVCVQGFGHAVGAILMDLKKATTVASITVMTFMLAGGFFVAVSIFLYRNHTFLLTYQFLHIYIYIYPLSCRKFQIS